MSNEKIHEHIKQASDSIALMGSQAFIEKIAYAADRCVKALASGHKIMLIGNGGSAAQAQHMAAELAVRMKQTRPALAAIALTDSAIITAAGNDLSFAEIFSRQIEAVGQRGDILIAISTSGNSPNIVRALEAAWKNGIETIGMTGNDGGAVRVLADAVICVPSDVTEHTQEMHLVVCHALCGMIEKMVF